MFVNIKNKQFFSLKQEFAFTLAEVLITLGIIGIVAAMTIPSLISDFKKKQAEAQIKQTYAIIVNALNAAKADYGSDMNSWYVEDDGDDRTSTNSFVETYLLPYLKTTKTCKQNSEASCQLDVGYRKNPNSATKSYYAVSGNGVNYGVFLANGAVLGVNTINSTAPSLDQMRTFIIFDINGQKPPNIMGLDAFQIELGGGFGGADKNLIWPYGYGLSFTRSNWINGSCNPSTGNGEQCFCIIFRDGFKIADDYSWQ